MSSTLLLSLLIASAAAAVTMEWTFVGSPGNPADTQVMADGTNGYGDVPYAYYIGTYEVTNAQYAEFLNSVADADPNFLYSPLMSESSGNGGITRGGSSGSYTYSAMSGREHMPVNWVGFYNALRFANWLHNGQPVGPQGHTTTEGGAYTITAQGISDNSITRNVGAMIFLPSEDEWYKAAYYDPSSWSYFDYPGGSNSQMTCVMPSAISNTANCDQVVGDLTDVGSYTGSASPYGTFDQGGNVGEWIESIRSTAYRGSRGGNFYNVASDSAAWNRGQSNPQRAFDWLGFRVAMIPEPSTGLLMIVGLFGLAGWRRAR